MDQQEQELRELALQYVAGWLDAESKMKVFELIRQDLRFRQYLKEELTLFRQMQQISASLPPDQKSAWLKKVKSKATELEKAADSVDWMNWIFKMTMPSLAYHTLNQMIRRC